MKVAAFMDCDAGSGGAFHQGLAAILQVRALAEGRFELLVCASGREAAEALRGLGVPAITASTGWSDRGLALGARSEIGRRLQRRLGVTGGLEAELLRRGVDLVYFVSPSPAIASLQKLSYIATVLDLCHRDFPEFPEVRDGYEFHRRETFYRTFLPPAVAVIADSPSLATSLVETYGVRRERVLPMPYAPSPFLDRDRAAPTKDVLARHGLEPGYLFYPAQFWAHKNHVRILQAMAILRKEGAGCRVVFSGRDWGTRAHVERLAETLELRDDLRILGFVPPEDLRGLYRGSRAVVMPTYFGPTNIPPLEAFSLERPLVYSRHLAAPFGDAALAFDPDNAEDLARAIRSLDDPAVSGRAVRAGAEQIGRIQRERFSSEGKLSEILETFDRRRQCWS